MKNIAKFSLGVLTILPTSVFAALGDERLGEYKGSLSGFLGRIQTWLLSIAGGLAVLFIVYGGFIYMTSGGNKERIETAKKTLTYAILGLILVALSGLILEILTGDFLTSIFGNNSL